MTSDKRELRTLVMQLSCRMAEPRFFRPTDGGRRATHLYNERIFMKSLIAPMISGLVVAPLAQLVRATDS
jgi:hypothetical protein